MLASFHRIAALTRKEMAQLWRDTRLLLLILLLPIILLFLFAYAVTLTVDHLPTAVADQSHDERSRDFIQTLVNSGYFDQTMVLENEQELIQVLNAGQVKAGILIPPDFSEQVARNNGRALILLDGSDSFTVQSGFNAASALAQKYSYDLQARSVLGGVQEQLPILTSSRVLYNPDMNDLVFILPGLVGMLVQNIIVAYASMAIVRERELGIMEQILVTPARPAEMVIAKLIPGAIVAMIDMAIVLGLGITWFGIPMHGSIWLFSVLALVFILAYMGLGLMISAVAKTQRQAQQISVLLLLFGVLLTGFIFPRTSMPDWTQAIGDLIPLTYFVRISRGIISKGLAFDYLWQDTLILAVYALVTVTLASLFFKKRLD
jgi:ABC-2 type transport system permease protein